MTEVGSAQCIRDEFVDEATAGALTLGTELEGYICPQADVDWYKFTMPASDRILSVDLRPTNALSPVQLTYAIRDLSQDKVVAQPNASDLDGSPLQGVFCVDPGELHIAVRDDGDDDQETRNVYKLSVTSQPELDVLEPNDSQLAPTPIEPGQPRTGAISCVGDEDWYGFQIPEGRLLRFTLDAPQTSYQPKIELIRFIDADQGTGAAVPEPEIVASGVNLKGKQEPTAIDQFVVVPEGGQYYLVVSDDNAANSDPGSTYTVGIEFIQDDDPNEPNNSPDTATDPLNGAVFDCAARRSTTITGTIGSPGDDDWFRLSLANCQNGVLDASVVMSPQGSDAEQWEFNDRVQATLTVVRPHLPTPCARDEDCISLNQSCGDPIDCAGYLETCLPDGLCAGATACLPEGVCGANSVQRRYECRASFEECRRTETPPPNQARTATPILDGNVPYLYVRVSDFQADAADPNTTYTLTLGVRPETDAGEPSNLFTNVLRRASSSPDRQGIARAQDITVRDATAGGGCNPNSGPWVTGVISYENDTDWFRYPHPCPGQDCTLRMYYETDAGPVDHVINVYRADRSWAQALQSSEEESQPARTGRLGGISTDAQCYYAFQGHSRDDGTYFYYVEVRDRFALYSDDATVVPASRDFSGGQRYRFCIEKVANECIEPPCRIFEDGCGLP